MNVHIHVSDWKGESLFMFPHHNVPATQDFQFSNTVEMLLHSAAQLVVAHIAWCVVYKYKNIHNLLSVKFAELEVTLPAALVTRQR